jgi:TonB family protein
MLPSRLLPFALFLSLATPALAQTPPTYQPEIDTLADRLTHDIQSVPTKFGQPLKVLVVDFVNDQGRTNLLGEQVAAALSQALQSRLAPDELITTADFNARLLAAQYSPEDLEDNDVLRRMTFRLGANLLVTGRLFAFKKSTTLQINLVTAPDGTGQSSTSADLTISSNELKLLKTPVNWPILPYAITSCDLPTRSLLSALAASGITPPRCTKCAKPEYPRAAQLARWEGPVLLNTVVDETGKVLSAKALPPAPYDTDEAAVQAVKHWQMAPATKDGKPVRVCVQTTVIFHLER